VAKGLCSPYAIVNSAASAFRPVVKRSVSDFIADTLVLGQPGVAIRKWDKDEAPYMIEPANMLASHEHDAVIFVGPARTGKTVVFGEGFLTYAVLNDPGDFLFVQMTTYKAREYSKTRLERAFRYTAPLAAAINPNVKEDALLNKRFKNGMFLNVGWPSISHLSGSDYRYVVITDYDRLSPDVEGEGSPYMLALKRTQTFGKRGMCAVESSPGFQLQTAVYDLLTPHMAPPADGILSLYNSGDKRRWYWTCLDCSRPFEAKPGLDCFGLIPDFEQLQVALQKEDLFLLAQRWAKVVCPNCGCVIDEKHKKKLNKAGFWLRDLDNTCESNVASFWLGGVAAAYQSWLSLILKYLQNAQRYFSSADEEGLKTYFNTDLGMPYTPMAVIDASKDTQAFPVDKFDRYVMPLGAVYLTAAVDVQGGKRSEFVVEVQAHGPYGERWIIDRYKITESMRKNAKGEALQIEPNQYLEDWDLITMRVLNCTYKTTYTDLEMKIRMVVIDSRGEDGVSSISRNYWRSLKPLRLHERVRLYMGIGNISAPAMVPVYVGERVKDVPALRCNPSAIKDKIMPMLRRLTGGGAKIHLPHWLPREYFNELRAETKIKGRWVKSSSHNRNEAIDLCVMNDVASMYLGTNTINWRNPPAWARPIPDNIDVITKDERRNQQKEAIVNNSAKNRNIDHSSITREDFIIRG